MSEVNNHFTGSKMNKDLSPRLIPSTQYIDARNATVLNSEGGESGLLQNVEGNTLLTNLNLTGENLEIVGLFSDKILDRMFLFVTNWNDPSANGISNFASPDSSHYICMYDIKTSSPTTLVSGNFLNFSKTKHILAVNLLEDLLFFTDNRNQPRKINVSSAISNPTYYTNEDNISVLRYFPWNAPRLSQNILSPNKINEYPLEMRSELLITTQPQSIFRDVGAYIGVVGTSGWTSSNNGVDAVISITIGGTVIAGVSSNQFISSVSVSGGGINNGGNDFIIGETITISTPWTGLPSPDNDIVLTIGSQNIAQTPTMKDVVSENLPGAVERAVVGVNSVTEFEYGSPVTRGVSVWNSLDGILKSAVADSTPRPILLTEYLDGTSLKNFDLLQGSSSFPQWNATGLEITVNVYDVGVAGALIVGDGALDSSIITQTSGATIGTYTNVPYSVAPWTSPGPNTSLTQIDLVATSATEVQVNVITSTLDLVTPTKKWMVGDDITFAAGTMGSSSTALIVRVTGYDIQRDQFTVAVVKSGKNYSPGQQIKIKKWSDDGPIPGLLYDLILELDGLRLALLPDGSFVNSILTTTTSNGTDKIKLSDNIIVSGNTGGDTITHSTTTNIIGNDIVTLGANPLSDPTFDGDKDFLSEKFVRFSYRFKFDDNQYSLIAPFTQAAFIPRQDGYFMEDSIPENINDVESNSDENRAIKSTIIAFFENKVNQVGITIDMPEGVNTPDELYDKLKVIEIDILYKDANEADIKVIDTITRDSFVGLVTNQYTYNYNSSMPIRTLRSLDFTRAADKAPIRAKAQEIAGNRVMYGNYLDRTARPNKLNYIASSGEKQSYGTYNSFNQVEYPNHNLKQNRSYEVGIVLADKFGRQSDVISSDNSTVFNNYRQNRSNIKSYLGDSLKIDWRGLIPSVIDKEGYAGLYSPTNPLGWYSYKVVVKQSAQDYYNVYLPTILNNRPQPNILRINVQSVKSQVFGRIELTSDSDPLPDMWIGSILKGTVEDITASSIYITGTDTSGMLVYFHNPDGLTVGDGWASLTISPKSIETDDDLAFITLFSDNINKVPRDLKSAASQDLTFSSSSKLYARVYNSRYWTNSNSSRQYFPNTNGIADDVGRIGLIPDIGADRDSRGNLAYVSTFYSVPLASVKGGNPYVASINTEKLIGATGGNSAPEVSFEKLRLNVYETAPFESNLDIYYESSSSGLISQLNNYINQDSDVNQPSSITGWSWELNENNAPEVGGNVSWLDVVDGTGNSIINPLDTTPLVTGEIIKIIDGSNNILSNTSYFKLVQNIDTGADKHKFKIKTAAGRYFAYDSNSPIRDRYLFVIRFTNTLANGEVFSNDITILKQNQLDNAVPSYTSIPNPIPTNISEFTGVGYRTIYQLDGKNGSANTTDPSVFKLGLLWTVTNVEFLWVGKGSNWTPYSPFIYTMGSVDYDRISWMGFTSTSGSISAETLSYSELFVNLDTSSSSEKDLYIYANRTSTQFRVSLELNDASGINGNLSTTTTIYFTLLK